MYEFMEENGMFGVKHIQTGECFLISNHRDIVEDLLEMIKDSDVEPVHIPDIVYDFLQDQIIVCKKR